MNSKKNKVNSYFWDYEIVPPEIFFNDKIDNILFISPWQIQVSKFLRFRYGVAYCNNYYNGGYYKYRGTRLHDCDIGAKLSLHKRLSALDLVFKYTTAEEVREDIKKIESRNSSIESVFKRIGICRIEDGVSWIHVDSLSNGTNKIHFFNP